jgi:PadR family transcriptional regulator
MTPFFPAEWLRGTLGLCVLGVLAHGASYGYAITQRLEEAGLGAIRGGTLYPLLARLESEALIKVDWRAGEGGPSRKYIELTEAGRTELAEHRALWHRFNAVIDSLTGPREAGDHNG